MFLQKATTGSADKSSLLFSTITVKLAAFLSLSIVGTAHDYVIESSAGFRDVYESAVEI